MKQKKESQNLNSLEKYTEADAIMRKGKSKGSQNSFTNSKP